MNGEYAWWFLVVGLCVGGALVWVVRGQMAREEDDVAESERAPEGAVDQPDDRTGWRNRRPTWSCRCWPCTGVDLRDADPFEADLAMETTHEEAPSTSEAAPTREGQIPEPGVR